MKIERERRDTRLQEKKNAFRNKREASTMELDSNNQIMAPIPQSKHRKSFLIDDFDAKLDHFSVMKQDLYSTQQGGVEDIALSLRNLSMTSARYREGQFVLELNDQHMNIEKGLNLHDEKEDIRNFYNLGDELGQGAYGCVKISQRNCRQNNFQYDGQELKFAVKQILIPEIEDYSQG